MKRREFITLLGGAAVGVAARGRRASGFPTSSSARFWASIYCATLKMAPDGFKDFWRD